MSLGWAILGASYAAIAGLAGAPSWTIAGEVSDQVDRELGTTGGRERHFVFLFVMTVVLAIGWPVVIYAGIRRSRP